MRPKASIVYLTKNAGEIFVESLKTVFSQIVDFEYEVIVVDSGSTDQTLTSLKAFPVKLASVKSSDFNFGMTRDYSFSLCTSNLIIPISQDVIPADSNWLQNLVSPLNESNIAVVQGKTIPPLDENIFYWEKIGLFYFTRESKSWISSHNGIGLSFTACAIRRAVWEENKIGPVEMSEDKVFQKKINESGKKIVYAANAIAYHGHQYGSISSLAKRCINEGLGWREAGQNYSFADTVLDLLSPKMWREWIKGLLRGKLRTLPEILFPLVRPICIYKGNHFVDKYVT